MASAAIVSLAVMAGIMALAGVPLRCWQFYTGRTRSQLPQHALARATFSLFAPLILVPNVLAWAYALLVASRDFTGNGAHPGAASALAVGLLGCAYLLLEGFLLTARHHPAAAGTRQSGGMSPRRLQPGNALSNSAANRE